ncbi:MAG: UDP-N-acetylmuramate--L-alanine ligase [Tissierellales bacterium]|nr:UDP-N-acetylmuramate--L-alanine ligase [Tissierellales bacterium]
MFEFNLYEKIFKKIHFIGIGGISMSGLAEILHYKGFSVTGTDVKRSSVTDHLENIGIKVFIGHDEKNIDDSDLVIYTDAVSQDNEELNACLKRGIPLVDRATFLGALMKNYKNSIGISGTHGKTTTTSMLASILNHNYLDPTMLVGGNLDDIGGNVKLGSDDLLLTEACEYKANILKYFPTIAVILNIDEDHLDYFEDIEHIKNTFKAYFKNIPDDGYLVVNIDDENINSIISHVNSNIITFGINNEANINARNIEYDFRGYPSFDIYKDSSFVGNLKLNVMGEHNIYNALAAYSVANLIGIDDEDILKSLSAFHGVHRRLENKGFLGDIKIIDDYAHHPTEIMASLRAIRNSSKEKIYCVFQPHTFTRTRILLDSFAKAFSDADKVIIADIYAAREKDLGEIHSRDLAEKIRQAGTDAIYLGSFEDIENFLLKEVTNHDIIVTMGAGNVYEIGENLLNLYNQNRENKIVV